MGNILKTICHNAGVKGRKVNHSARKTTVTSLLHSNVEPTQIMQITGHKNIHSVNNYSSASIKQQMEMSNILSNVCCGDKKENIQNLNVNNKLNGSNTANNNHHVDSFDNDNVNEDLLVASQEIEDALNEIGNYETLCEISVPQVSRPSAVDLPIKFNSSNCLCSNLTRETSEVSSIFSHASIKGDITINMYHGYKRSFKRHDKKRKRIIMSDSDDSD